MKTRLEFPFSESEGGAPEQSSDGQRELHFPSLLGHTRTLLYKSLSGAHPTGEFYQSQGGVMPRGVGKTIPVVYEHGYNGLTPLALQPRIDKPNPWE